MKVYVTVDTGACWGILNHEVAELLDVLPTEEDERYPFTTAAGTLQCALKKIPVRVPASDGDVIEFEAGFYTSEHWKRECFVGYHGFLELMRFGVDPANNYFYFSHC